MAETTARGGRPVLALLLYLLAVFAGGALLAPWLYLGVQSLAASFPALQEIAEMPFGRYMNRALLITALVGLPFFVRGAGIRRWADVGVEPRRIAWRRLGAGFVLGFVSLAAVCAVALVAGARTLRERSAGDLAGELAGALATAMVVAVIEELLFRGAIFGGLRRAMPWGAALVLSSALYGIVHFMTRPVSPEAVGWASGVRALPTLLAGMADPRALVPGFFSLTLAGVILGLAYQWTGDLAAPVGIHAGWIFWLKFYGLLTSAAPGVDPWFWGTRKLTDGWLAFVALVVVLAAVALVKRRGDARGGRRAAPLSSSAGGGGAAARPGHAAGPRAHHRSPQSQRDSRQVSSPQRVHPLCAITVPRSPSSADTGNDCTSSASTSSLSFFMAAGPVGVETSGPGPRSEHCATARIAVAGGSEPVRQRRSMSICRRLPMAAEPGSSRYSPDPGLDVLAAYVVPGSAASSR